MPQGITVSNWLTQATRDLKRSDIDSARLDAEIILAHTLKKSRTWLHAHNDETIEPRLLEIAETRIELRKDHVPIAYIVGHKEFYGRLFKVTPSTLIPRPESEALIDLLKKHTDSAKLFEGPKLIDVGTGSGCLGITAKLELPEYSVTLSDISRHALSVAKGNAESLHAEVQHIQGDLLDSYPIKADCIIANLPYVDTSWYRNQETDFEPGLALFAQDNGLALIFKLISRASNYLAENGQLLIEADPRQHEKIIKFANDYNFILKDKLGYALLLTTPE